MFKSKIVGFPTKAAEDVASGPDCSSNAEINFLFGARKLTFPSLRSSPKFQVNPGCALTVTENKPGQNFSSNASCWTVNAVDIPDAIFLSLTKTCKVVAAGFARNICIAFTASRSKALAK